ncbi:hypothetical protein KDA11_07060 [Candidatus Saccharibacteria bacterium]|nr:hypothetical protein [Candidatus Saccharibacteria bacterium]
MSEAIKISTGKYQKSGKVEVDGKVWTVNLPGASTELKLGQAQRRLTLLDKKIEAGEATETDLDKYDEYEEVIYSTFSRIFQDGTKDNSEVKLWMDETPMAIIAMALEDIKSQANGQEAKTDTQSS